MTLRTLKSSAAKTKLLKCWAWWKGWSLSRLQLTVLWAVELPWSKWLLGMSHLS